MELGFGLEFYMYLLFFAQKTAPFVLQAQFCRLRRCWLTGIMVDGEMSEVSLLFINFHFQTRCDVVFLD